MKNWTNAFTAIALSALSLGACQSVKSDHVDLGSSKVAYGLHYAAPKALVRVELVERDGELLLGVSQPFLVGDPEAAFTLSASSGLLAFFQNCLQYFPVYSQLCFAALVMIRFVLQMRKMGWQQVQVRLRVPAD